MSTLTASGKFRVFSVLDEPRRVMLGVLAPGPEAFNGDWTFEPVERSESPIDRLRRARGMGERLPLMYAPTYPDIDEALRQAEIWDKEYNRLLEQNTLV